MSKREPPVPVVAGPEEPPDDGLLLDGPGPVGPVEDDTVLDEDDEDVLVEDTTATAGVVKSGLKLMDECAGGAPLAAGCWIDAEKDCCGPWRVVTLDLAGAEGASCSSSSSSSSSSSLLS